MNASRSSLIQIININNWFLGGNHFREGSIITGNQIGGSRTGFASVLTSHIPQWHQKQFARLAVEGSVPHFPMKSTSFFRTNRNATAKGIIGGVRSRNPMRLSRFGRYSILHYILMKCVS